MQIVEHLKRAWGRYSVVIAAGATEYLANLESIEQVIMAIIGILIAAWEDIRNKVKDSITEVKGDVQKVREQVKLVSGRK